MLSYCLKCKKNTERTNQHKKKSTFIKEQKAKRLLSNLSIRTPLSKIQLLGDILF